MVAYPSKISDFEAFAILAYGLICTYLEYQVDHQKEVFRKTEGKCEIWGKPASFVVSFRIISLKQIHLGHSISKVKSRIFVNCN